jgi:membrane protease YdiL (CAAX protease family)
MGGMMERLSAAGEQVPGENISYSDFPVRSLVLILSVGLVAGLSVNALPALGEELAWRGFLLTEFKNLSFIKASLIIGSVWGIWHAPLILMGHNYPQHPLLGVPMMIAWRVLLTPFFIYITIKSRSVLAAAIMHGTMNATAGLSIMFLHGGSDLTAGITGLAGMLILLVLLLKLIIYDVFISREKILLSPLSKHLEQERMPEGLILIKRGYDPGHGHGLSQYRTL